MKKNSAENYESINIYITKDKFPIIYETKVKELVEQSGMTRDEAEKYLLDTPIELELYYEFGLGLFGVESDAVECSPIYSPYSRKEMEECEDDL